MNKECIVITGANSILVEHIKKISKKKDCIILLTSSEQKIEENIYNKDFFLKSKDFFDSIMKQYKKIHIIHCAGIIERKFNTQITNDDWTKFMYVHLYYLHELIKILLERKSTIGNIVALSTPLTTYFNKKNYLYISSKVAMEHYIKQLAYNEGVLANIISPGYFRSNMNKYQPPSFDVSKLPLAREITAKEIAEYIYKFVKENKLLIGQNIILDGGATLGY